MAVPTRVLRITNRIRALWKWCLSFWKRDWELSDYPVYLRVQTPDPDSDLRSPRFKLHRYVLSIVNWNLSGSGDTEEEALQDLKIKFSAAKEKGEPLPRPGVQVPIKFASQERVKAQTALADDFIDRVLGLEWAWISDESSLWDFHADENNDVYYEKIKETYGVDVSDIESAKLSEILERIATHQKPA
jgi:hypothetical protein